MPLVQRFSLGARACVGLLALTLFGSALLAQAGAARAAFDSHGIAVLHLSSPSKSLAYGKKRTLLLLGYGGGIVRINASGSIDRGFGTDGHADVAAIDAAVSADGKILVLSEGPAVTRLLPNGAPDPSFGGGTIQVDLGGKYDSASAIMVDAKGRILIGGVASEQQSARGFPPAPLVVVRLRPGGAVDRSFGQGGRATLDERTYEPDLTDLAPGPRGSIFALLGGREIFKLRAGGSLDSRFGERGVADLWALKSEVGLGYLGGIESIAVTRGGKVVLAGTNSFSVGGHEKYRAAALRLLPDGSLDPRFGEGGLATARVGSLFFAGSMLLQPSGRLVVAGSSQQPAGHDSAFAAVAFDPRGRLDRSFGTGGKLRVGLGGTWTSNSGIVSHQGGRAILVGWASENVEHPGIGPLGVVLARIDLFSAKRR